MQLLQKLPTTVDSNAILNQNTAMRILEAGVFRQMWLVMFRALDDL